MEKEESHSSVRRRITVPARASEVIKGSPLIANCSIMLDGCVAVLNYTRVGFCIRDLSGWGTCERRTDPRDVSRAQTHVSRKYADRTPIKTHEGPGLIKSERGSLNSGRVSRAGL